MSLSVKIIDNDTGEVLVDEAESVGIAGVLAVRGNEYVFLKKYHTRTQVFQYLRCDSVALCLMVEGLQQLIINTQKEFPHIVKVGEVLNLLSELEEFGGMENKGDGD